MDILETRVDTNSEDYKANYEAMEKRVATLREELRKAREDRSEKAFSRHTEQGKLPVRKRLEMLLDPGSPFLEVAPLAAWGMYDKRVHGAGIVGGVGVVEGREVMINANDAMIKGGTIYPLGVKKSLRLQQIAMENRLPCVNLIDSGGAFLPLQSEIFPDAQHGGRVFYNQAWMSKMGIPQVTAVMGLCTAGGAYIPAMSDYVVQVRKTGAIFLGGPPLVKAATGEEVTSEELGGVDVHCRQSGVSDFLAESDEDAIHMVRQIVRRLPKVPKLPLDRRESRPPLYDPKELYGIVPQRLSKPYDVREVIARIVDGSEFLEFKPLYGSTLVCGFAYLHGYQVGILGNNGVLFPESAKKATQFIQLCDRDSIPLVFLQNINGFIIGKDYEASGITKDGHKMVAAVSLARVPKITMMLGGSFGAGNYAMCGRAYSPRFLWMWPHAQTAVMGGEQAADVMITVKNDQLIRAGEESLPPEQAEALKQAMVENSEEESHAYYSTSRLWDDGVIDPAQTRDVIGLSLAATQNQTDLDPYGYGVFRM
ncbi:MAG: methylcrotonoyl-CoA carboxylase [Deltaproteobacteria bacterium]|nr:MAG: methylcrotonoyl-CoA carboxylase [Deltaproteobacteria bacterium]